MRFAGRDCGGAALLLIWCVDPAMRRVAMLLARKAARETPDRYAAGVRGWPV